MQKWHSACKRSLQSYVQSRPDHRRGLVILANGDKKSTTIARLLQASEAYQGQHVEVRGFVQTVRKQSKVVFAAIRDGSTSTMLQAVLSPEQGQALSVGQAVRLKGTLKPCRGRQQTHELQVDSAVSQGENNADANPLQNKYQSDQFLRTLPHLRPRMPSFTTLLRLRSLMTTQTNLWFDENDFVQIHTPIITSSDCEGAGEVFNVTTGDEMRAKEPDHHFKAPKYLTVSAQLHLEAMCQAVDKVWTLSPTFRAEKSDTARHLSEFYMLEAELAHTEGLDEVLDVVEQLIRRLTKTILENKALSEQLVQRQTPVHKSTDGSYEHTLGGPALRKRWDGLVGRPWPRVSYREAFGVLQRASEADPTLFEHKPDFEDGLHAEHERFLAFEIGQGSPIFVTHYPRAQKPFYMLPSADEEDETVDCFDLIAPDVCELAGGSLREYRSSQLQQAMEAKGLLDARVDKIKADDIETNALDWYMDLRKFGSVPHGGFGIGFDRLLCYLAGVSNVRDMVAFPRWHGRCDA